MSRFCTHCGNTLPDNSVFCTNCGQAVSHASVPPVSPAPPVPPASPNPAAGTVPVRKRNRKKITVGRIIRYIILVGILVFLGLVVWKTGETTGFWRNLELKKSTSGWSRQSDYKTEAASIDTCLDQFTAALEKGDVKGALTYVHPDQQKGISDLLTKNQAKLPALISALKNRKITYLSTSDGNYEALRMATVLAGASGNKNAGTSASFTVILVKTEKGWVVDSL